jgi:hypothetical protein
MRCPAQTLGEGKGGRTAGKGPEIATVETGSDPASRRSATERGVKLFDNLELP